MPVAAAGVEIGLGLYKTIKGLSDEEKTKNIAEQLGKTRPKLGRDRLADENLALTKSDLAQGQSAKAEAAYKDITDRDLSSSLSAILKGGGNLNSIGDIYGSKEEGRQRLSLMKDNLRLTQIQNEINASKAVSERNDQQFQFNEWMPWADKTQANAAAREQAAKSVDTGLQTVGSAAMQFGQEKSEQNFWDKYFGKNGGSTPVDNNSDYQGWSNQEVQNNAPQGTALPTKNDATDNNNKVNYNNVYNDAIDQQLQGFYGYLNRGL